MTNSKPKKAYNRYSLRNPKKPRRGETIGGGYFVFRRGDSTGRIRPALWPFEYASVEEANAEAARLSAGQPGEVFIVVGQQASHVTEVVQR